jgi:hypothetical protein
MLHSVPCSFGIPSKELDVEKQRADICYLEWVFWMTFLATSLLWDGTTITLMWGISLRSAFNSTSVGDMQQRKHSPRPSHEAMLCTR